MGLVQRFHSIRCVEHSASLVEHRWVRWGWIAGPPAHSPSRLFCLDDGTGLTMEVWAGFDTQFYRDLDDMIALEGEVATLRVEVTDPNGVTESAEVDVELTSPAAGR